MSSSSDANPAGGGDEAAGDGGGLGISSTSSHRGTTPFVCNSNLSRTLGRESESRKRKAAVVPTEFYYSMGNEGTGDLDVPSEDCYRVSKEIENLRSQLALKKKELKCYQQNKKLRVELDLKVKDVECLRKENEELKTQNKDLQENIVQILDSQIEFKKRHFQQTESLRTRLELSNARLEEETKNLHERNSEETCCLMSHPSSTNVLKATLEDEVRNLKARDEDHLKEITDIWKQLHVRDQEVKDFSAALEIFNSKMTAAVKAVSDAEKAFHPEKVVEPHDPEGYLDSLSKRMHNNLLSGLSLLARTLEANLMLKLVGMESLLKNWPQPATEDLLQPTPK